MKVYKFIFIVGLLNLTIPFLGVPFMYKNYALIALAVITVGYSLVVRAVEKEKQNESSSHAYSDIPSYQEPSTPVPIKKIEEVVEMVDQKERIILSDVVPKRRGRKPKVTTHEDMYE